VSELVLARTGVEARGEARWNAPPLGLAYLAGVARSRAIDVRVVDGRLLGHRSPLETSRAVLALGPRFVGVSAMTVDFPRAVELARQLKQAAPSVVTILGGAHANALPRESLIEAPGFDFVLAGECAFALTELLLALGSGSRPRSSPGLGWREDAQVHGPSGSAFLEQEDLDRLPRPAWDLFPRATEYPVATQLGCPYRCVFCSHNSTRTVRQRDVASVVDEIAWLDRDYAPRSISFIDETFGLDEERTSELLDRVARLALHAGTTFSAQTRADCVSPSLLRSMKRARFEFLEMGVESGDPEILERSGKGLRLERLEAAVRGAREAGLKVWLKFILGLPGETLESIRRTIELAVKLNPARLSVATIVPYPGSQVYAWARSGEMGYRLVSSGWGDFDKYLGACLEVEGLSYRALKRKQAQMYLEVYLRNGRVGDLGRMVFQHRALVGSWLARAVRTPRAA
jgi:radical SAM superfamily enzyme YgiQ (UPF0313 family)